MILFAVALVALLGGASLFLVGIRAEVKLKGSGIVPGMTGVLLTIIGVVGLVTLGITAIIQSI